MRGFAIRPALLALAVAVLTGCGDKKDAVYLDNLRVTQSARETAEPRSVDDLKRDIDRAKKEVERTVKAAESLGTYYRLLAIAYSDRQMYGEALTSLEEAMRYYPENEEITYLAGVCAARMAKAQVDNDEERARLFALAEKYYLRTLFLYGDHRRALFALAVVYAMETNRPADAVPLLRRYLAKDTSNVEVKALLARTQVALANYEEALALYNEIIDSSASEDLRQQATENAKSVEKLLLGGQ